MIFLGHYVVDNGDSYLDSLHSIFEITFPKSKYDEFRNFIKENLISETSDWIHTDEKSTLLIGCPSNFKQVAELRKLMHRLNS